MKNKLITEKSINPIVSVSCKTCHKKICESIHEKKELLKNLKGIGVLLLVHGEEIIEDEKIFCKDCFRKHWDNLGKQDFDETTSQKYWKRL